MRNITVSVDDDVYRRSRIRAAELGTSVSVLVRSFLGSLVGAAADEAVDEAHEERRRRRLREVIAKFEAQGIGLHPADNLSREELYDRDRARADAAAAAAARDRGSDSR